MSLGVCGGSGVHTGHGDTRAVWVERVGSGEWKSPICSPAATGTLADDRQLDVPLYSN